MRFLKLFRRMGNMIGRFMGRTDGLQHRFMAETTVNPSNIHLEFMENMHMITTLILLQKALSGRRES